MSFDPTRDRWRKADGLHAGETICGTVVRLPRRGAFNGSSVFLELDGGDVVALPATAKKGATVLERLLGDARVGDEVEITFCGWRTTADGERQYRNYELRVLGQDQPAANLDDYRSAALEDPHPPWWAAA